MLPNFDRAQKLYNICNGSLSVCAGQEMDDVYVYDLKAKTWKYLSQVKVPIPRSVCISSKISVSMVVIYF